MPGVVVGEGAVVGAASVVVRDVEPWSVVAGNPAETGRDAVIRRLTTSGRASVPPQVLLELDDLQADLEEVDRLEEGERVRPAVEGRA